MTRTQFLWVFWLAATLVLAGFLLSKIFVAGDRTVLLPGQTAGAHHQIDIACETCHVSKPFASEAKLRKDINKTCVTCHKEELALADDSHPIKKFKNPRMAAYWEDVDARWCTTCHAEHKPEITLDAMVTLQGDFCVACHSKGDQDVRVNRESHADLTFETCATAGCHNFHDNKALYEDFLVKHAGTPWLSDTPVVLAAALPTASSAETSAEIETYLASVSAPEASLDDSIAHDWAVTAHAANDVTCASCHAAEASSEEEIQTLWTDAPGTEICASCHKAAAKSFAGGKHGMRGHNKVGKPRSVEKSLKKLGWKKPPESLVTAIEAYLVDPTPPQTMTTDEAMISFAPDALSQEVTCISCHKPHKEEPDFTNVTACLTCHSDEHTLAYEGSKHQQLWQDELNGLLPAGSGVTCATCHMPQHETKGFAQTNHNQNDTLRPNEKMIRPVCLSCHGLGFAIDALADPALILNNFSGQPSRHVESIDWAIKRVEPPKQGANQ